MTGQLVSFHQRGGLWYAFLGVHVVGMASETGKWMSALDGDVSWRRSAGDLAGAKAAIGEHVRQWYDAAHQPLVAGQAERLCEVPRRIRPKEEIKIREIDPQAIALRIKRDGTVVTYVLPPVVDSVDPPAATLAQARMYCVSAHEVAWHKLRAVPRDRLTEHELAVFAGLVRLIDACSASDVIKAELKRAVERAAAERAAAEAADREAAEKEQEVADPTGEKTGASGASKEAAAATGCAPVAAAST